MPRTKANVIAAAERQKAIFAKKGPTAKGAEKRKGKTPVRSRQWRMKWFRQVRAAQSNKAAGLNYLNATGMKRLVKEIQQDQRPDLVMRWQPEAIDAIRGTCSVQRLCNIMYKNCARACANGWPPVCRGGPGADDGVVQGGQRHHRDLRDADDSAKAAAVGGAVFGDGAAAEVKEDPGRPAAGPGRESGVIR
jgi:hypothetical protein